MIHEKVLKYLRENFPGSIVEPEEMPADFIPIYHEYWVEIAAFLRDDPDFVDFSEISPELSRGHRGLRIWLPLKMHGAGAFRRQLDEKLDLAQWITEQLRGIEGIEIVADPQLSLVAFRLVHPGLSDGELNELNRRFLQAVTIVKGSSLATGS